MARHAPTTTRRRDPSAATPTQRRRARGEALRGALRERILVLDGAMGTMLQGYGLDEADFRGERFADHPRDLRGANDLLCADAAGRRRARSTRATSPPAPTSSPPTPSTRTRVSHGRLRPRARRRGDEPRGGAPGSRRPPTRPRRPTRAGGRASWRAPGADDRTASLSPDVNDPGARNVDFEELVAAYLEAARGLVAGRRDLLLIETIFDTLNAKAAIFAVESLFDELGFRAAGHHQRHHHRPLRAGRSPARPWTAFWNSVRHARPLAVGLNCALGGKQLRPYVQELAGLADTFLSLYPNAGLPNAFGGYDETPPETAGGPRRAGRRRRPQHRRRLLRHEPGAHRAPSPRPSGVVRRAGPGRRAAHPPGRPGAARHRPGQPLRQRRRAHQRHRLATLRAAHPRRPLRRGRRGRAPAGRERRPGDRHQHGRGAARLGGGHDALRATSSRPSRTSAACRS